MNGSVLQKDENGNWKWGHEIEPNEQRYEWFKLEQDSDLASRLGLNGKYSTMAIPPKDMAEVEQLVTNYLTLLRKHAEESIKNTYRLDSVMRRSTQKYIITVPAVWSVSAQNMTLRCARNAGMALSSQPEVISEPEAAAIYGLGKTMNDVSLNVGDTFVICDAGGGTVDLITYKITELGDHPSVIEAAAGSGDLCGSTFLDREFSTWLQRRFCHLREWDAMHLEDAMGRWMDIKKGYDGKNDTSTTWTFPGRGLLDNERLRIRNGTFKITGSHVKQVFQPIILRILELVKSQISESQKGGSTAIKAVLLAGGFGNNPYLKAKIQEAVGGRIMVDRMHDTETAVVRGALLQGLANARQDIGRANIHVRSRKARNHFGVAVLETYDPAIHDRTKPRLPGGALGSERIKVVEWFISQGDEIMEKKRYPFNYYFDEKVRSVQRKNGMLDSFTMPIYIWTHDRASRPKYPPLGATACHLPFTGSECKKIIELKADMNKIPEEFRDRTASTGEQHYKIPFTIEMIWHSANIEFKLVHTTKTDHRLQQFAAAAFSLASDGQTKRYHRLDHRLSHPHPRSPVVVPQPAGAPGPQSTVVNILHLYRKQQL
ncbi:hypothetical protein G7054_g9760 [Neopestalotiopsis clavispora]|nr:hypothetical protein G7054_g9760 [Neopestalotiopsis clavispora]